jgi:hypothetical protein
LGEQLASDSDGEDFGEEVDAIVSDGEGDAQETDDEPKKKKVRRSSNL